MKTKQNKKKLLGKRTVTELTFIAENDRDLKSKLYKTIFEFELVKQTHFEMLVIRKSSILV